MRDFSFFGVWDRPLDAAATFSVVNKQSCSRVPASARRGGPVLVDGFLRGFCCFIDGFSFLG
jgi:hypothetical protein